jgi:hypothetical protein
MFPILTESGLTLSTSVAGEVKRRERLGGLLNYYYYRTAALSAADPTQIRDGCASASIRSVQPGILCSARGPRHRIRPRNNRYET